MLIVMMISFVKSACLHSWQNRSMKDISNNMRYAGKRTAICNHFCSKRVRNAKFYDWFTYLEGEFVRTMCEACALREKWGYHYKSNKNYQKWIAG